jgi:hypothetical protein
MLWNSGQGRFVLTANTNLRRRFRAESSPVIQPDPSCKEDLKRCDACAGRSLGQATITSTVRINLNVLAR